MYGVVGAADLAKFGLFMSLGEVNKLTYANFSNADDTIHAKTMTESLKDVFTSFKLANHSSKPWQSAVSFFTKATRKFAKIQSKNSSFNLAPQWNRNERISFNDVF